MIDKEAECLKIQEEFQEISSLYIADGHHRAASAVKVGLKRRKENPGYTGEEEFNYFLSVVFPAEELTILAYNRVIKDLNGLTEKAFLGALKYNYELMLMPGFPCKPVEKHCMGMYVGGEWYHLKAWEDIYKEKDVVGQLDVSPVSYTHLYTAVAASGVFFGNISVSFFSMFCLFFGHKVTNRLAWILECRIFGVYSNLCDYCDNRSAYKASFTKLFAQCVLKVVADICPVSYTHLDVYKRQELWISLP